MSIQDRNVRLIGRLDVKGENLIKGVHLEGLRIIGDPQEYAERYYQQGADELIYMDIVASLYGRSNLTEIVRRAAKSVFVPMTVGGGVRSVEDVRELLRAGADKVAINTAAVKRPELISESALRFGSQCVVLSLEAKKLRSGRWEVYTDCGREGSGLDALDWVRKAVELGAGEVLVTSIDQEGTRKGFDCDLVRDVSEAVHVPVIASGGYGEPAHLDAVLAAGANAVAFADALHYGRTTIGVLREQARELGMQVRVV
ncbi:imidazole glycerol phosphate synthase subunit HisF [Chitinolyticbacter meiyuanensis]|uniref:imidazole glycerol phosphate synthase subunit HisF n=1 Tax=Chitinolyticbacter meiyuanensis TaxID=682798 RepID=UPI0011E59D1A|nr:imidazole glycerol phosphate synthase cyclase subunit [Chitinolyticbacter meiyuanensis]